MEIAVFVVFKHNRIVDLKLTKNPLFYLKVYVKWDFHAQGRFDRAMTFNCCVFFKNET